MTEEVEIIIVLDDGRTKKLALPGTTTLANVLAQLQKDHGVSADVVIFEEDDDGEADLSQEIGVRGNRHIICHRCKKIEVEVNYNGKLVEKPFRPGKTVKGIIRWAVKELELDEGQKWKLHEGGPEGTALAPKTHIGSLVKGGKCAITLYLTGGPGIQG